MKIADLRELEDLELLLRERDVTEDLLTARFQHHTSQLASPARLRQLRREVARIKTVVRERERERALPRGGLLKSVDAKQLREKTKYAKLRAQFGAESKE
jgi:large subunit ribosomal protein L29